MYILLAIIAFGVLIFTHELGHFLVAKACDVKVTEFSMGMGPAILTKQGKETLYALRLFPIGGFCAMEGEDEDTGDPRAFAVKKPWQKILILVAGAASNFLTGVVLLLLVYAGAEAFSTPTISAFMDGCPYENEAQLQVGDTFYKIDGHRIYFASNVSEYLGRGGDEHSITVLRDGKKVKLEPFVMSMREYTLSDGSTGLKYGLYFSSVPASFGGSVRNAWYTALDFVRTVWRSLGDLVRGAVGLKELSGPVGIVDMVNDVAKEQASTGEAIRNLVYLFALIAVNLAVMNMLPIPALDGGRVFLLLITALIEALTHKKVDPKYEGYIHTAGFVLLMGLMVFVMFNDVIKIIVR